MMNKYPNQAAFIRDFNDEKREQFNPLFFYRSDDDIIIELQKVILSCQRDKHFLIQVESFEVIDDYEEILEELRIDEMNRNPKDKDNKYNYLLLKDSKIKKDAVINISAIFGSVTIFVPENVKVKIVSTPIFGGVSDERKTKTKEAKETLYINATCVFGGVDIK